MATGVCFPDHGGGEANLSVCKLLYSRHRSLPRLRVDLSRPASHGGRFLARGAPPPRHAPRPRLLPDLASLSASIGLGSSAPIARHGFLARGPPPPLSAPPSRRNRSWRQVDMGADEADGARPDRRCAHQTDEDELSRRAALVVPGDAGARASAGSCSSLTGACSWRPAWPSSSRSPSASSRPRQIKIQEAKQSNP